MAVPGAAYYLTGLAKTAAVFKDTFFGSHRPIERLPVSLWDKKNVAFFSKLPNLGPKSLGGVFAQAKVDQRLFEKQTAAQQQQLIDAITSRIPTSYGYAGGGASWDYLTGFPTYSETTFPSLTFSPPDWMYSPASMIEDQPEWLNQYER
jgi:hypothetical protein